MGAGTREAARLADQQERTRVVSVVWMGASVGIWNRKGDVIKRFGLDELLQYKVKKYLKENDLSVNNADSFDGWLDEFQVSEL